MTEKTELDHLQDVLDAQLAGDTESVNDSFHNYLTLKTTKLINNDHVDAPHISLDAELDAELDDVDVSDIDISDHIPDD